MSGFTVLAKDKKCATCVYWTGPRKVNFMFSKPHSVTVEGGSFSCNAESKKNILGGGTCTKWRKWDAI